MRIYEIILIFSNKDKISFSNFLIIFKNILIHNNFIILNLENWGLLKLKYKIKGEKRGVFFYFKFYSKEFILLSKILNYIKLSPFILRFFFSFIKKKKYYFNKFCLKKRKRRNEKFFKKFKLKKYKL